MSLTLQSQLVEDVVVIRCRGRMVAGAAVESLQQELDKQTKLPGTEFLKVKKAILNLAETEFVDSSGLGALVHLFSTLRGAGAELKFCELSPFVERVLKVTNLLSLFHIYASEAAALESFARGLRRSQHSGEAEHARIVCIDTSRELLAYVNALLKKAGFDVYSTRRLGEAVVLVKATKPRVVICGPGILSLATAETTVETFRRSGPNIQILHLPGDFSTAEAGQAGVDLVNRLHAILQPG